METKDYLAYLVKQIHTVIIATVDDENHPVTAAIDMMDYDDHSLYFLTAKGKNFYERLISHPYIALTGLKGEDTMSSVAISISGKVRDLGYEKIPYLFEKNPYMHQIYPTEASMHALTALQIYDGHGEWFDLSKKPIERASFAFGAGQKERHGYFINENCIGCGNCTQVCPESCIESSQIPFVIEQSHCLHCGRCQEVCQFDAIIKR